MSEREYSESRVLARFSKPVAAVPGCCETPDEATTYTDRSPVQTNQSQCGHGHAWGKRQGGRAHREL